MKLKLLFFVFLFISGLLFVLKNSNKSITSKSGFDAPNRAALLDFEKMKDPALGSIPFKRFPAAMRQTKQLQTYARNANSLTWTPILSDMGGRTKTVCVDPNDASHHKIWAGSATGGLWLNNNISDANSAWQPKSDVWEALSVSSIVFDPNNSQTMYVGTGEYETAIVDMYRESSGRGYGIWKSTDDGQTFTRLASTDDFAYISDLVIKNNNGQSVIYAGVVSGTYRGHDFTAQPSEGLYRSTDGGQTWEQVLPNVPNTNAPFAVSDIEITGNGKIIVGTKRNQDDVGGGHILVSTTGNSGSWTLVNQFATQIQQANNYNIPGRVKIASAPSNSNKIYAVFAAKSLQETIEDFPQTVGTLMGVSSNGGQTWQALNPPASNGNNNWAYLAWHALSITVDPNNENTVFAGGLDTYKSINGGVTWSQVSDWRGMYNGSGSDDYVHADIHRILYTSSASNELIISSDGGVFYTNNANAGSVIFQQRNKSFATLQFYSAAIKKNGYELLAGGLQDNGTVVNYGGVFNESDMIQGGDGAFCMFDDNEQIIITSTYDNQFKVKDYNSGLVNYIYDYASGLFTTTFDYDSANNVIWAIASDLHNNRLGQVLKISQITGDYDGQFINLHTNANTYFSAIRLLDDSHLLIGTANGHLYKVSNINNNTPVSVELGAGVFPDAFMSCIQTRNNGQEILITLSNYGVTSVWHSTNSGQTWQNVESNLPDMPIRWAIFHPSNGNQVMLATETGVWTTDNINANPVVWTPQNNGFPNVRVDMLDVRPDNFKVVAGTHGRTMFTTTWNNSNAIEDIDKNDLLIFPNPAVDFVQVVSEKFPFDLTVYDMNGREIQKFQVNNKQFKFSVSEWKKGIYLVKTGKMTQKLVVD